MKLETTDGGRLRAAGLHITPQLLTISVKSSKAIGY